jgi:Ca2+-binding RTX toxin-like protein
MSFHFLNGNTYGPYADTGPGTIIVDPLATIQATGAAALNLQSGPWTIDIKGTVQATGASALYLSSSGTVSRVTLGGGANVSSTDTTAILLNDAANVTNRGKISGADFGLEVGGVSDRDYSVKNLKSGVIAGVDSALAIYGSGTHTIANAGTIQYNDILSGYAITGHDGIEKVTNYGKVFGDVSLGDGNDIFTNFKKVGHKIKNGLVTGTIDLGTGNDTFFGGNKIEGVRDGSGADIYKFGGGNDYYIAQGGGASDGNDRVSGGSGIDTYAVGGSGNNPVFINIDSKAHTYGAVSITANTAQGIDISGGLTNRDKVTGFENVGGSEAGDIIFGNSAANEIVGGSGNDVLFGLAGNDKLLAGPDADILIGGKGADQLFGQSATFGGASATFTFKSLKDSTPAKEGRDTIHDFKDGTDKIDLSAIDADSTNSAATNEGFQFLGVDTPFNDTPGGLRVVTKDYGWLIQADVNGDKKADFAIDVLDANHTISWSAGDFDL